MPAARSPVKKRITRLSPSALTMSAIFACVGIAAATGPDPVVARSASYAPAQSIDSYRYDYAARGCVGRLQPGTIALRRWLEANYPGRGDRLPVCRSIRGGTAPSLHGEGRANDHSANANTATGKRTGDRIVARLLATDAAGNKHALARRMGIQEIIWNRRIWTTNHPNSGLRGYGGVNPHTDHVHIGLHWRGARMRTSFWRRAGGQPKRTDEPTGGNGVRLPVTVVAKRAVVHNNHGVPVAARVAPRRSASKVRTYNDGNRVDIVCQTRGEEVTGKYGTSDLWDLVSFGNGYGAYVTDTYVDTGSDARVVARDC